MNKIYYFILLVSFFLSCSTHQTKTTDDFEDIKKAGELTVITINSSTSYFIYKNEPMGYQYDLIKAFADEHRLKLNVKIADNSTKLLQMLANKEGDIVTYAVPVLNELRDSIRYCGPKLISHQVLVQAKAQKDSMVHDVTDLIGKEVYVKHNTKYHQRLINLNEELGNGIIVRNIEKDTITVEDLIEMVAHNEIKYTIADEYIAKLNKTYFKSIDISVPVSFEQRSSWAVRKTMPVLADSLTNWMVKKRQEPIYKATLKKYFEYSKNPVDSSYLEAVQSILYPQGKVSKFDHLFKKYATVTGYDWQLLAAIAYQESRFKVHLTSWAGAVGLMGLMPRTAGIYGVKGEDLKDPEKSIMAGANYIKYLSKLFRNIPDTEQRIKFVLASYNGGNGHIYDARALARKYGDDPDIWDNSVEKYIELKSKPEYYNDPVVRFGYLRGHEVVNYVSEVTANWRKYQSINMK